MKYIKVGGIRYAVSFSPDFRTVGSNTTEGQALHGECNYVKRTIRVHDSKIPGEMACTFFHELTHAIVEGYCIKEMQDAEGKHNEDSVELMAMGLSEVFKSLHIDIIKVLKANGKA